MDSVTAYGLTEQGRQDLLLLGQRFRARFPYLQNVQKSDLKASRRVRGACHKAGST